MMRPATAVLGSGTPTSDTFLRGDETWAPAIPAGLICMWSGLLSELPANWALCVTGDTEILLADGTRRRIDVIVENREQVDVMAFDPDSGLTESRRVTGWFKRSAIRDDWIRLLVSRGKGSGRRSVTVSCEHPVWIEGRGWTRADKIQPRDCVLLHQESLSLIGKQALAGMYLGDGSIDARGVFKVAHGGPQALYARHIASAMGVHLHKKKIAVAGAWNDGCEVHICSVALATLDPHFHDVVAWSHPRKVRKEVLSELGAIGLAYWYMDDGNLQTDSRSAATTTRAQFHTEGFSGEELLLLIGWLKSAWGINATAYRRSNTKGKILRLDHNGTERLCAAVAPYVHPSMRYKLTPSWRNVPYLLEETSFLERRPTPAFVHTRRVNSLNPSKRCQRIFQHAYDVKVDGLSSYIANGFIVHNCDGSNGTPDLRDRFIKGVSEAMQPGGIGGAASHSHTYTDVIAHTHPVAIVDPGHTHTIPVGATDDTSAPFDRADAGTNAAGANATNATGSATTGISATTSAPAGSTSTGNTSSASNEPPYYRLAFVMKL